MEPTGQPQVRHKTLYADTVGAITHEQKCVEGRIREPACSAASRGLRGSCRVGGPVHPTTIRKPKHAESGAGRVSICGGSEPVGANGVVEDGRSRRVGGGST